MPRYKKLSAQSTNEQFIKTIETKGSNLLLTTVIRRIKIIMNFNDSNLNKKIENLVDTILEDVQLDDISGHTDYHAILDRNAIIAMIDQLETILFPGYFANTRELGTFAMKYELSSLMTNVFTTLSEQITKALPYNEEFAKSDEATRRAYAETQTDIFLSRLNTIREYLKTDVQAAYDGDPAALNTDEIIYSYPGFYAIMVNRLAHELYLLNIPMLPRIMTEHAHSRTGLDIHPGATIGKYFFIDHATGVVIGETTVIGDHVKIYQGVTLGGMTTRAGQGLKGTKRHPTIGNNVTIYSNASILGGETIIGEGCTIAGNSFITHSIAPFMRVSNKQNELLMTPAKKIR